MARRFALVPESWLEARLGKSKESKPGALISEVIAEKPGLENLAELLPKNMRNKAKIILHYLNGIVNVDNQQRVLYDDGVVGSHLLDLVRYFVCPFVKSRPIDAPKFREILESAGVPASTFSVKGDEKDDVITREWKKYK